MCFLYFNPLWDLTCLWRIFYIFCPLFSHFNWWGWEVGNDSGTGKVDKKTNVVRDLWAVCFFRATCPLQQHPEPGGLRAPGWLLQKAILGLVLLTCFQTFQRSQPGPSYRQVGNSETTSEVVLQLFVWRPLRMRWSCFPCSWTQSRPLRRASVRAGHAAGLYLILGQSFGVEDSVKPQMPEENPLSHW